MASKEDAQGRQEWGLLTGWRMIAQEVIKDLDNSATDTETQNTISSPDVMSCTTDVQDIVQRNRLKSVIAKRGDNFYLDYQMEEEIGSGAFGRAIKSKRRSDQEIVVVKELIGRKMTQKEIQETKNEVKVLAHLNHPNVVKYYDFYADRGKMHIVMEYCQEGDLSTYLKSRNGVLLDENEVMMKFVQVCLALHHIHDQGILHRDLKSQNIFLSTKGILKLGDFGISRVMDNEQAMARSMVGTPYYLSPEICEDKPYGPKSDVWSLGCVLYELCMLKHAFDGQSLPALVLKILSGNVPEVPSKYSTNLESLVKKLLCKNPDERPLVAEILNFDFVRHHLQHYAAHIHFSIERRRDSFQRSLEPYNLQTAQSNAFELNLHEKRTSSKPSFIGIRAADYRASSKFGNEGFALDNWEHIEDEEDENSFEISPYRNYTKDEELDGGRGLKLRSTQTELPVIPETPLSAELAITSAKIMAIKQKFFGSASVRKPSPRVSPRWHSAAANIIAEEYNTDNEEDSEGLSDEDDSVMSQEQIQLPSSQETHVAHVVAQIQDIMKHPSTQLEAQ